MAIWPLHEISTIVQNPWHAALALQASQKQCCRQCCSIYYAIYAFALTNSKDLELPQECIGSYGITHYYIIATDHVYAKSAEIFVSRKYQMERLNLKRIMHTTIRWIYTMIL